MSLVKKYRPRRFEDVVGQAEAVQQLSGLILRGRAVRDFLVHGPRGLGKTTLVPIYAMALNCTELSPMGSPCGACENCGEFSDYYRSYNVPKAPSKEAVLGWVEPHIRSFADGLKRTLFFDEAQAFEPGAMEALLPVLEDHPSDIAFCFATTEPRKFKTSFKSRNFDIAVEPLSFKDSLTLLERTASSEGYTFERDALVLIAKVKRGYARDLLQGLEQVALYSGHVTAEAAKEVLDLEQGRDLVDYLVALAKGDEAKYLAAKRRWRATSADKIVLIRAFLTSLFYQNILNQTVAISPTVDAILDGRRQVLAALSEHLRATRKDELRTSVVAMMEYWFEATIDVDDGALETQLACFEEFVRRLPERSSGSVLPKATQKKHEVVETLPRAASTTRSSTRPFLQYGDIQDIMNRASFFVQHYGKLFNASCLVTPAAEFAAAEGMALGAVQQFCRDLAEIFADEADFSFIALPERDGSEVFLRVVAHLPHVKSEGQLRELINGRGDGRSYALFDAQTSTGALKQRHRAHWKLVRDLCAGFVAEPTDGSGDLLSDLGIALKHRRTPGPLAQPGPIFSSRLSDEALAKACELKMYYLSAFDAQQWSFIGADWELEEYKDRREEIASRKQILNDLQSSLGQDSQALADAIVQLEARWEDRAEDRQRSWSKGRWF